MKNKSSIITFIFVISSLFLVVLFHKLIIFNSENISKDFLILNFIKDVSFILITGVIFRFIIINNNRKNAGILEKLNSNTKEIIKSNERYDIVAKATSDTIWD
jgi:hypothetical protein